MRRTKHDYTPLATFDKQLGLVLVIATSFSNHILRAQTKVTKWTQRCDVLGDPPFDDPIGPHLAGDTIDDTSHGDLDDDTYTSSMEIDDGSVLSS